jgi:arabinogalactan oligomer/maltooligosaccharide transport system permease protein
MKMAAATMTLLKIALTIVGVMIASALFYPVAYIVAQALIGRPTIILTSFKELVEYGLTLDNFRKTLEDPLFYEALRNTLIIAALTIVLAIAVIIPAAYAFSRFDFLGKDTLLYYYLIVSQAGGGLGVIAVLALYIFLLRVTAYGVNMINMWVLPFIYTSGLVPFQTWLMKSYFDQLPKELDEASFIDGAGWFHIIFRVIFPASKAAFIIIILFAYMSAWGEFIIATILQIPTLGWYVYTQGVAGQAGLMKPGVYAAAAIIYAIPMIILFALAQRYIGQAYRLGIKG